MRLARRFVSQILEEKAAGPDCGGELVPDARWLDRKITSKLLCRFAGFGFVLRLARRLRTFEDALARLLVET